jgi:GNAT superfamily N-acetyltransferase
MSAYSQHQTLALPKEVEHWSLAMLREKLVKIGAKVVRHGRENPVLSTMVRRFDFHDPGGNLGNVGQDRRGAGRSLAARGKFTAQHEAGSMIHRSSTADSDRVIDAIMMGFASDPILRWMFPEPQKYLAVFPTFTRLFGGRAFDHGAAFHSDGYLGGALWLPPGIHPDGDGLIALLQKNLENPVRDEIFSILEQMDRLHPEEPCWHLAFIAVDPTQQNKGLGSALLEQMLPTCDRDKTLAYLESTNPANLSLYERHGFKLLEKMQAGSSPPMFAMRREPR